MSASRWRENHSDVIELHSETMSGRTGCRAIHPGAPLEQAAGMEWAGARRAGGVGGKERHKRLTQRKVR